MKTPRLGLALLCTFYQQPALAQWLHWQSHLKPLQQQAEIQQVETINRLINQNLNFASDRMLWHQDDYWATPGESLERGQGDCEDFAIAKYFLLLRLGVPSEKLWLIYVLVQVGATNSPVRLEHMVLGYQSALNAEMLILDNMLNTLLPLARRPDLTPLFRFNTREVQINSERYPVTRLARWQNMLERRLARQRKSPLLEP